MATPVDLACFRVRRMVGHEVTDDDRVVVLRPRFMSGPFAWWLQPRLSKPHFHVKLDAIGSFVWRRCDEEQTIGQIVNAMEDHFGEDVAPATDRLMLFLGEMERGKMVELIPPGEAEPQKNPNAGQ